MPGSETQATTAVARLSRAVILELQSLVSSAIWFRREAGADSKCPGRRPRLRQPWHECLAFLESNSFRLLCHLPVGNFNERGVVAPDSICCGEELVSLSTSCIPPDDTIFFRQRGRWLLSPSIGAGFPKAAILHMSATPGAFRSKAGATRIRAGQLRPCAAGS